MIAATCLVSALPGAAVGQVMAPRASFETVHDIAYRTGSRASGQPSAEEAAACRLDLHHPVVKTDPEFATVVWFHGGGLTGGKREIPKPLQNRGFAVAGAGYRLSPKVEARECIADAAAAVAWVVRNIADYGGDPARVFVSGHSAGGYLANMVGIDERWLDAEGIDFRTLAGVIPYSGHSITHFTIRAERGVPDTRPVIDEFAPLYHVRKDAPPFLLLTGDRDREMLGRYEETAYFWRMLRVAGHRDAMLIEFKGRDHNGMVAPGHERLIEFVIDPRKGRIQP
ncbi:MAG: alpha/beta hydrolase [Planctomycetia bacterium]|nr:alpha/beta hydrolase [Planctomycetia bacterium]